MCRFPFGAEAFKTAQSALVAELAEPVRRIQHITDEGHTEMQGVRSVLTGRQMRRRRRAIIAVNTINGLLRMSRQPVSGKKAGISQHHHQHESGGYPEQHGVGNQQADKGDPCT